MLSFADYNLLEQEASLTNRIYLFEIFQEKKTKKIWIIIDVSECVYAVCCLSILCICR
jgi:hypothetical protein